MSSLYWTPQSPAFDLIWFVVEQAIHIINVQPTNLQQPWDANMLIWNTTSEECFQPLDEEVKAAVKVNRLQPSISIMKPNVLRQESGTFVLEQLEHRRRFFQEPQGKLHLHPFHSRERHTSPQPTSLKLHTNTHKIKKMYACAFDFALNWKFESHLDTTCSAPNSRQLVTVWSTKKQRLQKQM